MLKSIQDTFLCILCLFAFNANVYAQTKSVATLSKVSGAVEIINNDRDERNATRNQIIFSGDTIKTGASGNATVNFFDLTRVVLRPNSTFIIKHFPQTIDGGQVKLALEAGAARVINGTISNSSADSFLFETPKGTITSSRSDWLVRLCGDVDCIATQQAIRRCGGYYNPEPRNEQWVSVYKGNVRLPYCGEDKIVKTGMSNFFNESTQSCKTENYVPCFILADKEFGRDKLRHFLSLLEPFKKTPPKLKPKPPRPRGGPPPPRGGRGNGSRPPPPRR